MRKVLKITVVVSLLLLMVLQANGITVMRCTHSGRISLAEAPAPMDCGMSEDSDCVLYFTFKVSDFSSQDIHFQSDPLQFSAILVTPVLPERPSVVSFSDASAISESPPGRISHTQFALRN